ncbi:MAG: transposase, partial [Planctomycetales bacterium]|nr:transposase [Planctomycetales bacterium]
RRKTRAAKIPLTGALQSAVATLSAVLDRRMAFRLTIIISGMLLADGRRTASAWFVAGGVRDDWDRFYDCLVRIGWSSSRLAVAVLSLVVKQLAPGLGERVMMGIDDSPTTRFGKKVEGAGVHHNPTPGPADGKWLYGHNWVCLAWLARHPLWGVIALPLWSLMYVREVDVPKLAKKYGSWEFRTKHELGVCQMQWLTQVLKQLRLDVAVWLVVDGAYAARPFLLPILQMGVTVVSRLRKDAGLYDLPPQGAHHNRIYGKHKISLVKRAGHRQGWKSITYDCRGEHVTRQYKTFLATSKLISGQIRVVLLRYEDGSWAPYFCTDVSASVEDILVAVGARWGIEEHFASVKEIWGAGQQQVRNVMSNIGCWNLNGWLYTLVEICSWDQAKSDLVDRSDRSWDNAERRPSHADRRRKIAREMLRKPILAALPAALNRTKFKSLLDHVIQLAA